MTTVAAWASRWIRKLPAALLGLDIPCEYARAHDIARYPEHRVPVSLCSYSDAEYQIMLRELHYPSALRRVRER